MKRDHYTQSADLLKVLAHPTRLCILVSLKDGTKCVSDVCDLLSVSQPNLSQHLSILRREGIVGFTEEGKKKCYYLKKPEFIQDLMSLLEGEYTIEHSRPPLCCSTRT